MNELQGHPIIESVRPNFVFLTTQRAQVVSSLSRVQLFGPHGLEPARFLCPWDFPGKNWSGLPFPSPGDLPNPGIKPRFPALQADSSPSEPPGKPL